MFAERLKLLRLEADLTQTELAKQIKISQPSYSDWEKGVSKPSAENINKLAKFFNVSIDYLLGNTDDKYSDEKDLSEFEILYRKTSNNLTEKQQEILKEELKAFLKERSEILKEFNKEQED